MGTASSGAERQPAPAQRRRLAVFQHGLGFNGAEHGRALMAGAEAAGWHIHFAQSSLGSGPMMTMVTTLRGIKAGGERLALEIQALLADEFQDCTEIALIGASLGGLFCRRAAGLLWGAEGTCRARPRVLVTLATPHLGVRGLYNDGQLKLATARRLTQSVTDLMWDSPVLAEMADGDFLVALQRFDSRIAYAATIDDGIVAYPTAAITPASCSRPHSGPSVFGEARDVGGSAGVTAEAWCGNAADAFAGERVASKVRAAAIALLSGAQWRIIDIGVNHRNLAALRPDLQNGLPNEGMRAVAADVWRQLNLGD